jgi:phosphate transport system permease protein
MSQRSWSRLLTFGLAMIPVAMLVFVVGSSLVFSLRALVDVGLDGLFSSTLKSWFLGPTNQSYGLLGPIWGTVLVALVALGLALPASLAFAIVLTELRDGLVTRTLDGVLSTFAGIPPIAYALMAVYFMEVVMRPKFTGLAIDNHQVVAILGWDQYYQLLLPIQMPNSTILGGMLLGLLIQPFMTPLIRDALRSVPRELREASYALGAGRWYTLGRVVLPWSLPGIMGAVTLGTLKAVGDVTIAYFVIGSVETILHPPAPLFDVFARTPPLASTGAGLMGGIGGAVEGGISSDQISVAYFTGVLLLLLAFGIMLGSSALERALRRRLGA